jgi:PII-like signaling protein
MEHADLDGKAKRVRIYVSEGDLHGHQAVHHAIVALLRKEGAAGATVLRGLEGFGKPGVVHTSHLVDIAQHLPVVVEWVDTAEQVARLLPRVKEMVKRGLITVDDTEVLLYCAHPAP